jgi:hypothetical protein
MEMPMVLVRKPSHAVAAGPDGQVAAAGPEGNVTKNRSPSFPFIALKSAIERLEGLEKHFGRHPVPAGKAGMAWGMREKSSQADQTLAALRSFGLIEYEGMGPARTVSATVEGRTYLRSQSEAEKQRVLKQCAVRPRIIRNFWTMWGADRPADGAALDVLTVKNGFSEAGAANFLKVYDDTIAFAGLSGSDKIELSSGHDASDGGAASDNDAPPQSLHTGKVRLMAGEREFTSGLLSKEANFRLIVTGPVGVKEIERLIKKLEFDLEILAYDDGEKDVGA